MNKNTATLLAKITILISFTSVATYIAVDITNEERIDFPTNKVMADTDGKYPLIHRG